MGNSNVRIQMKRNPGRQIDAYCIWDGNKVYTNMACSTLTGGGCSRTWRHDNNDSCKQNGYYLTPFRSKRHYYGLSGKWGRSTHWFYTSNVWRPHHRCGGCTRHAMNYHTYQRHSGWRTFDG